MDPLSIIASITGILTAAANVSNILGRVRDAPESISDVLTEVNHIKIVITALQKFLDRTHHFAPQRAALIQLDDVVIILTQTALVFSELQTLVQHLSASRLSPWQRLNWIWQQPGAWRLVNQLQRNKTSLSLLLQIIQCNSDIEAQQSAASLQEHIEQQVEGSSDLAARLEQLQLPPDANQPGELISTPPNVSSDEQTPAARDTTPTRAPSPPPIAPTKESIPDADPSIEAPFEDVLLTTRVYERVKDREIDAMSTVSTNRSRAWSILSGLSLTQASVISVIKLPLHDSELRRFQALAYPSSMSITTELAEQYSPLHLAEDGEALYKIIESILVGSSETMNKDQAFHDVWNWILRHCITTTLINESDRQIALSGIVTMLSTLFNRDISDFIRGIWRPCLPYQLLWYVEGPCDDREASPQAPSWSWLSWGSSVEYHDTLPSSVPMISILHINDHEVRLQGFICELTDLKYLEPTEQESIAKGSLIRTRDRIDLLLKSMEIYEELLRQEDGSLKENLFVCQVCNDAEFDEAAGEQIHGLVLEPTMVERGHYRRVAYLNYLQKEIQMPERNLLTRLDQSLYQEFDEEIGYTFTIYERTTLVQSLEYGQCNSFNGEVVSPDLFDDPEKLKSFDLMAMLGRNSKEIRQPEIFACAKALKQEHGFKKLGAIGFCYGAWAVLRLATKGNNLVDCVSIAHPSLLEKSEIDSISVPVQICAPETDPQFTPELKEYTAKVLPTLNVEYDYQYFPGLVHGFAGRGDMKNAAQRKGLERAKNAAVYWFQQRLHPHLL